ncbi:phospholipase SGR2 isoform X1 [Ricinus communis]|uniref:phospholipase SGR2 isoform X1 n=1 Tax=Ricinus communis TaxID=3988 RepID=UPI00201AB7C0|nr:phospholipase SGR2 isoform X1 [Ricinus communis]XP_048226699.1 phospholipase SGR2 isoform X1 [Ricinus communis]
MMADSKANPNISEQTSPDLLKNTPSNIARLEDVIEHSKGRQKYLAQTRSPSDGSDVRWYFCKVPLAENESSASVPRSEIVGKSDYFRFGMRDSLAIEAAFLEREEELLSSWWKEYAECSEGPKVRLSSDKKLDTEKSACSPKGSRAAHLYEVEEERVGVPVKGGLYEVDLVKRHCFPVYWNGENRRVLRGHWFARKGGLDWLPLREDVAEQLEIAYRSQVWHRRTFQQSGLFAARVDLQGSTPGLHALFTGEDDTWEAWLNVDASGFSSIITLSGNGIKLRRGYSASQSTKPTQDELRQRKEEEMDDYCSQVPVRHVVFMVHGIGQRLEKSNLVDDVGNFRHITASLAERHLTAHQRDAQRVLYIPCQWRKGLKLSGETAVEKITLDGVRGLRVMLSATVHDVLYYMSPIYCQDIINSVSNQLNRLYLKFLKRNSGYDGKVSIYGHSLGSVLSYDILCHQENLSSPFPMEWMYKEHDMSDESSIDMKNQSSLCGTSNNLEGNNSSVNEATEKVDPVDVLHDQSTMLCPDRHAEDFSTFSNSFLSDLTYLPPPTVDLNQNGGKKSDDDLGNDSNNIDNKINGLEEMIAKDEDNDDSGNKDKAIKLLKNEIDSLKAKIAELESQGAGRENTEAVATTPKQLVSGKLSAGLGDDAPKSYTPYIKYTKLEFKVDTFFAVGSPLGVFLALRNIRIGIGKGQDYWAEENINEEMPACRQMFNIFHPFDPVAYRVEPLVCKEYIDKRPVIIPYHKGGKRLHIGFQEFTEDLSARSQAMIDRLNFVKVKVLTVCQSRSMDHLEEEAENAQDKEERTYGSLMIERLTGSEGGRIDHTLQDKTFEHPYLQAIGSHTNYWRDLDTALFILKHLYKDIPEEANLLDESSGQNSKDESSTTGWSDQRETKEEELPLTFSDRMMIRNFSRKAKKFMKT